MAIATVDGQISTTPAMRRYPSRSNRCQSRFFTAWLYRNWGARTLLKKVGVEPTGEAFNSTVLDEVNNRPCNPMVNAGAIAVSALVQGDTYAAKSAAILKMFERYVGHPVKIDEATFSVRTGKRETAIAPSLH